MHPSSRTGVRFVLANPSDPSRLDEFSNWYDTYSAAITVPGYQVLIGPQLGPFRRAGPGIVTVTSGLGCH
jgi:hypothetical protein